ncbi:26145_t:CDS:2, partial [Gigaspora rosea]
WYSDEKQIEPESQTWQHPFIIGLEDCINTKTSAYVKKSFPDSFFCTPKILYNDVHTKVNYRKTYAIINGLSKKAIQTSIDAGSSAVKELKNFMSGFITKYGPKKKGDSDSKKEHKENFIVVENPIIHSRKGASRKKRFKGSHEHESKSKSSIKQHSKIQKTRKPTQCQQYQNTGHNKAGCEAWHKQQGFSYSY